MFSYSIIILLATAVQQNLKLELMLTVHSLIISKVDNVILQYATFMIHDSTSVGEKGLTDRSKVSLPVLVGFF